MSLGAITGTNPRKAGKTRTQQQARRLTTGMVIIVPGDGRWQVKADAGPMVGNLRGFPQTVNVSMARVGSDTVIVRPMSAHKFVQIVSETVAS
jgi:hypothetical protein